MSITPVAQTATTMPMAGVHHHHHGGGGARAKVAQAAASALDMSPTALTAALQSGTTLASLAQQQGVSQNTLIAAVAGGLQAGAPAGAPALSTSQLNTMATNIVSGNGPFGMRNAPTAPGVGAAPPSGGSMSAAASDFQQLAQALGLDPTDLLSQLQSGNSSALSSLGAGASSATSSAIGSYGSTPTQTSGLFADVQA
jgi:lambda repressor-like predicted transcriptional regulator